MESEGIQRSERAGRAFERLVDFYIHVVSVEPFSGAY
jgi:hypothetical protein